MALRPVLTQCLSVSALIGTLAMAPTAQAAVDACLSNLRTQASAHGVSAGDFDRLTRDVALLESTARAARAQPESRETWWDYIAKTVDEERVSEGARLLVQYQDQLRNIAQQYAVDSAALVAIFGIETNYGQQLGKTDVLNAWLTRACVEKRRLWVSNVFASLRLLRDNVVRREAFVGSWSGAFGMTQFIPTSFYELAVDGDGDGRIDLYGSLPDALASSANHLKKRGTRWTRGLPAVIEVNVPAPLLAQLPASSDRAYSGKQAARTLRDWANHGVQRADGKPLLNTTIANAAHGSAYVFAPTGRHGPIFLATANFDAILHYNQSEKYALAVSLLMNRLNGEPPLLTPWPTDDPGLSRVQIRQLQSLLAERGHDVGTPDGIPGARTRTAIIAEQERLGLTADGRASMRILTALQNKSSHVVQ